MPPICTFQDNLYYWDVSPVKMKFICFYERVFMVLVLTISMASGLLSQSRPGWHFRWNSQAQWDAQVYYWPVLANKIDSVGYSIVPLLVRVMRGAEKAGQHLRVHC